MVDLDTNSAACYSGGVLLYGQAALALQNYSVPTSWQTCWTSNNLSTVLKLLYDTVQKA